MEKYAHTKKLNMNRKLFLVIVPTLMMVGCAKEPGNPLSPPPAGSYSVVLDATSSLLTTDDSTKPFTVSLKAEENEEVTYDIEIGNPCYLKSVGSLYEIVVRGGAYFKSVSKYDVSLIRCDIYEGKGINYKVFNNNKGTGSALEAHKSEVDPIYPDDSGAVYEYEINSKGWKIVNDTNYKPAFYSVTIFFEVK